MKAFLWVLAFATPTLARFTFFNLESERSAFSPCPGRSGHYSLPGDLLQVESIHFDPSNPKRGDTITADVIGTVTETISDGVIAIDAVLSQILPFRFNISLSSVSEFKQRLPLEPGPVSLVERIKLPDYISGQLDGQIQFYAQNDKPITCIAVHLELD